MPIDLAVAAERHLLQRHDPARYHIRRNPSFKRFDDLFCVDAVGVSKTDDAACRAIVDWPGNRANDIGTGDRAQVGVDFLKFDAVARNFRFPDPALKPTGTFSVSYTRV